MVKKYILLLLISHLLWAGNINLPNDILFHALSLQKVSAPYIFEDYIIFTYQSPQYTQAVSLAFAHEQYNIIHTYHRLPQNKNLFYLAYPIPYNISEISYRIIVDGVWKSDPQNPNTRIEDQNIKVSFMPLPFKESFRTFVENQTVHFKLQMDQKKRNFGYNIINGLTTVASSPARGVYVAGSFNNWDPFFHRMKKNEKTNTYYIDLLLPPGTYYYYFVVDGKRILDPKNPVVARESFRKHFISVVKVSR